MTSAKLIFVIIVGLLMSAFFSFARAHEEHFTSNGLGYDHVRSLCASGGDNFRATSLLCSDLRAHELAHSRSSSAGGFDIIAGGDEIIQVFPGSIRGTLGVIFFALFGVAAIFIGYQKLKVMLSGHVGVDRAADGFHFDNGQAVGSGTGIYTENNAGGVTEDRQGFYLSEHGDYATDDKGDSHDVAEGGDSDFARYRDSLEEESEPHYLSADELAAENEELRNS